MVTRGRSEDVPARAADPKRSNPLGVDQIVPSRQVRHRRLEVFGAMGGVLQPAGLPLALALVGRVECESHKPLLGEAPRIQTRRLLLYTAAARADDDRRARPSGVALGGVEMAGEAQTGAGKRDVCSHGDALLDGGSIDGRKTGRCSNHVTRSPRPEDLVVAGYRLRADGPVWSVRH